jgi:hypothetical protein
VFILENMATVGEGGYEKKKEKNGVCRRKISKRTGTRNMVGDRHAKRGKQWHKGGGVSRR